MILLGFSNHVLGDRSKLAKREMALLGYYRYVCSQDSTSQHGADQYCVIAASCQGFLLLGYDQYVAICEIFAHHPSVNRLPNGVYCIGA